MFDVTIRYRNGKEDTFRAQSVDFSAKDLGSIINYLKEYTYTSPSGQKVTIFLTPAEVAGVILNEVPEMPGPAIG